MELVATSRARRIPPLAAGDDLILKRMKRRQPAQAVDTVERLRAARSEATIAPT
jgi:tRNA A37 methylthiotransferase MiaB